MKPFGQEQLAQIEDYKYQGYIPVDHSMFEGVNEYTDGELEVDEEVPDVSTVPRFYIDDLEDVPDEVPDHEFHQGPFEDGPKFIEEPIFRAAVPAQRPHPVRASRPTLNHIFHEAPIIERPVYERPVVIEEIDIMEPVRIKPLIFVEEEKKALPIVFHDSKPRPTSQPVIAPRFQAPHLAHNVVMPQP